MRRTAENSQITDSVAEADLQNTGASATMAEGNLFQTSCGTLSSSALAAADEAMKIFMISHSSNTRGVATILGMDAVENARSVSKRAHNKKRS